MKSPLSTTPTTPSEGLDGKACRRAGAGSDDHTILNQFHRGLRGCTLEGVPLVAGLGSRGAHDWATAAVAFVRMAPIEAASLLIPKTAKPATMAVTSSIDFSPRRHVERESVLPGTRPSAAARSTNQKSSPTGRTRAAGTWLPPARIAPRMSVFSRPATRKATRRLLSITG
jgi:hypothetical protein